MNRFAIVEEMAKRTRSVMVAFSGGKDAIATLLLCLPRFDRVECYHYQYVAGLSFIDSTLGYIRKRFGVTIHEIPHFELADMRRKGILCFGHQSKAPPALSVRELENAMRFRTGIEWIAKGEKIHDSMERRGQYRQNGGGIFEKRKAFWPIAEWSHNEVWRFLKMNNVPTPAEYSIFGASFSMFRRDHILALAAKRPDDFRKCCAAFPMLKAYVKREQFANG